MTEPEQRPNEDLAREAADCIEANGLRGDQLRLCLAAFLYDCGLGNPKAQALARRRYEKSLSDN